MHDVAVSSQPRCNVFLIGMMGSGKSSVGRRLARLVCRPFLDLDREIERVAKLTIPEIFENYGEEGFRSRETDALGNIEPDQQLVVACGGGIVLREVNRRLLSELGEVIWLNAEPSVLYDRIKHSKHRPLLRQQSGFEDFSKLAEERRPFYEASTDLHISAAGGSAGWLARKIWEQILAKHNTVHSD
ncbi:MAG: shikimate kinase [Verrucomicrobiales bacterium]